MINLRDNDDSTRAGKIEPISAGQAAVLQLAPGLAALPAYALMASAFSTRGIHAIFALMLAVLLVEVPVSWALLVRHVRRESGSGFSFARAFPWSVPVPGWLYLLIGVPVIIFSVIMVAGVGSRFQEALTVSLFAWIPEWFVMRPDPALILQMSREMLLTLWGLMLVAMVVAGGVTQELYSRGFLLPRIQHLGRWAPLYNALLFAVFHLVAPWNWVPFFLMALPWAYLVWWRRSIKIGLFVHVGMLALQWLGMTLFVFGLVQPPS